MRSVQPPVWRGFLLRATGFASLVALVVWGFGEIILCFVSWQAVQDPRRRLLWEEDLGRWRVFLLGDSAFCSSYVDRPEETLWARLSQLLGEDVFPGALIGATQDQIVEEAKLVARARAGKSGIVFVNLVPSKFLITRAMDGNSPAYSKALGRRYAGRLRFPCTLGEVENWLWYSCTRPFFLLRNPEATEMVVRAAVHRPVYYRPGDHRNRVWYEGDGLVRKQFGRVLLGLAARPKAPTLDWALQTSSVLRSSGLHPIVVIFPLSRAYLDDCVGAVEGMGLYGRISAARDAEVAELRGLGVDVIDLMDRVPSEGFVDLGHTNARGDEIVAQALHSWLVARPHAGR